MIADRLFDAKDLRRAVRVLAEFVADEEAQPTSSTNDALEIYSSACRLVNDRLGESFRLIRLGQRSEALRQVMMEPNALEMYDELHFKNVKWLSDVCKECKLVAPPRLDATAAAALNQAFSIERDHKDILRQHRLLALSRAPLRRRLEVLRLIRKAAPTELFWQDDIAEYEKQRVEEIRAIMTDPKAREDWATVSGLYKEITTDGWVAPFPLELLEYVKKVRTRLLGVAAGSELADLNARMDAPLRALADAADSLKDPNSFNDGSDAADLIEQHEAIVERMVTDADAVRNKYELPASSKLLEPFVSAADWLALGRKRRKRWLDFKKAVSDLGDSLENGVEWYYVQEYYRVASEFHWPLPKKLLARFQERSRRGVSPLLIGGIVAVVLVAAVVVVLVLKS